MKSTLYKSLQLSAVLLMLVGPATDSLGLAAPHSSFMDSSGREIVLQHAPRRVVSLVPSVTEILLRLGAGEVLVGVTRHTRLPPEASGKEIVGGFLHPDLDRVEALQPDLVFHADLHKTVPAHLQDKALLIQLAPRSIAEGFAHIRLLGRIFGKESRAAEIIAEEERRIALMSEKIAKIPDDRRLRVMRLMGRETVMAPGDDSFQNAYIRAAGGIAPEFGRNGAIIPLSLEQWQHYNPQVLYGCGDDRKLLSLLQQPGWKEVDAVRDQRFLWYPCDLTCRIATHPGSFISWLAADIYGKEFGDPANFVLPEQVIRRSPLDLDLDYVARAEIIDSDIKDFRNKTLALTLVHPMRVISTLEGQRDNIRLVANHYFPPPSWGLGHHHGLAALRESTQKVLGYAPETTAMLFTGANMDNLEVVKKSYKALEVTALVTAGAESNAMRMAADSGLFYEPDSLDKSGKPGTINILLLTNTRLSPRAMSRAIITATEAKTAALQDLDIRSGYSGSSHQATGTGTDNIIVVEGDGLPIDSSGGHTKMGELMASAVYEAVQKAIHRQNGLGPDRSIFQRLQERHIDPTDLCPRDLHADLERILLRPRHAAFVAAALALSDAFEQGQLIDLHSFTAWCELEARAIAGRAVKLRLGETAAPYPLVINAALTALVQGLQARPPKNPTAW